MATMRTSVAWQGFRHSNLVTTSAPVQARDNGSPGDFEESSGAEEDGFVGSERDGSQNMMMEIMDKYVQAGEALAEKENDVRNLSKQLKKQILDILQVSICHTRETKSVAKGEDVGDVLAKAMEKRGRDVYRRAATEARHLRWLRKLGYKHQKGKKGFAPTEQRIARIREYLTDMDDEPDM